MKTKNPFFILGLIGASIVLAQNVPLEKGTITGDRVNVRGRPLGTAEICCKLDKGDPVEIFERRLIQITGSNTEEWVRIVLPEKANVWLQSRFIDQSGAIVSNRVQGRAGPSLMWPVLCQFLKGDVVQARTNQLDWVGVKPPRDASAWVSGHYVASETAAAPAKPKSSSE